MIYEHARRLLECGPLQDVGNDKETQEKDSLGAKRPAACIKEMGKGVLKDLKQKPSGRSRVTMFSRVRGK